MSLTVRGKVAIVGDCKVGKSAMITVVNKQGKQFPKKYEMTLGVDFSVMQMKIPETNDQVDLYLLDTSGHEMYSKMHAKYWADVSMVIAVYDCTERETFKSLKTWIAKVKEQNKDKQLIGCVVGAKSDLNDYSLSVPKQEGLEFASGMGFGFFESSAVTGDEIDSCFKHVAQEYYNKYQARVTQLLQDS